MKWFRLKEIEKKITKAMQDAFSTKQDRKMAIHVAAAAGAAIVATLPIGVDAWALRLAEIIMVICIASSYGEKLTKSAAKGLLLSSFAQLAGEAAAFAALEALEAGKVASAPTGVGPFAAYAAKAGVAVGLIETVGHLVISYYEKPKGIGALACKTAEVVGATADLMRIKEALAGVVDSLTGGSQVNLEQAGDGSSISFKGSKVMTESEKAEYLRKIRASKDKLKKALKVAEESKDSSAVYDINTAIQQVGFLESDVILDRSCVETTLNNAIRAIKKVS